MESYVIEGEVSVLNAIRRVILSEIRTVVIGEIKIEKNTTRLHNEIIKERLESIPVYVEEEMERFIEENMLEIEEKNEGEITRIVTTEEIKIKKKGKIITKEETKRIFPADKRSKMYIDIVRLRGEMSETIPGEELKLKAKFEINSAKENSKYNVVSKCTYYNRPDEEKIEKVWKEKEEELILKKTESEELSMIKSNYYLLEAQRYYIPKSYIFVIETIGVFRNKEIMKKACNILIEKLEDIQKKIDSQEIIIKKSETTIENCYDFVLENEDYTIGKVLETILYKNFYNGEQKMTFCGFKKIHPHDTDSIIRIAYHPNNENTIENDIKFACSQGIDMFQQINNMF